jgi:hypothetical protein
LLPGFTIHFLDFAPDVGPIEVKKASSRLINPQAEQA